MSSVSILLKKTEKKNKMKYYLLFIVGIFLCLLNWTNFRMMMCFSIINHSLSFYFPWQQFGLLFWLHCNDHSANVLWIMEEGKKALRSLPFPYFKSTKWLSHFRGLWSIWPNIYSDYSSEPFSPLIPTAQCWDKTENSSSWLLLLWKYEMKWSIKM